MSRTWDSAAYVNLGATLTGNVTLNLANFIHAYGTATGNIVFNAVSNFKNQSGQIEITASGANRTVGFNTSAFCTPTMWLLIPSRAAKVSISYAPTQSGKILLVRLGRWRDGCARGLAQLFLRIERVSRWSVRAVLCIRIIWNSRYKQHSKDCRGP